MCGIVPLAGHRKGQQHLKRTESRALGHGGALALGDRLEVAGHDDGERVFQDHLDILAIDLDPGVIDLDGEVVSDLVVLLVCVQRHLRRDPGGDLFVVLADPVLDGLLEFLLQQRVQAIEYPVRLRGPCLLAIIPQIQLVLEAQADHLIADFGPGTVADLDEVRGDGPIEEYGQHPLRGGQLLPDLAVFLDGLANDVECTAQQVVDVALLFEAVPQARGDEPDGKFGIAAAVVGVFILVRITLGLHKIDLLLDSCHSQSLSVWKEPVGSNRIRSPPWHYFKNLIKFVKCCQEELFYSTHCKRTR